MRWLRGNRSDDESYSEWEGCLPNSNRLFGDSESVFRQSKKPKALWSSFVSFIASWQAMKVYEGFENKGFAQK